VQHGRFDLVHVHEPFSPGLPYGLLVGRDVPPMVVTFHRNGGSVFYSLLRPLATRLAEPAAPFMRVRIPDTVESMVLGKPDAPAIRILVRSSFGRSLKAIRDDETAASALGKNVALLKTLAVAVSSALAAVAGSLFAFYLSFINVESFVLDVSVQVIAMVIIGGTGTLFGPVVGAAIVLLLPAALSYLPYLPPTEIGSIQQIVYGLAMVLLMIFRPSGLWGYGQTAGEGRDA